MKKCPYCGELVEECDRFCNNCGKVIPQVNVCPHCGSDVNDGDEFCSNCGKVISLENMCPHCGEKMDDSDEFCANCGKRREKALDNNELESLQKTCSNCGKQIDNNAVFCPYCGLKDGESLPPTNISTNENKDYINDVKEKSNVSEPIKTDEEPVSKTDKEELIDAKELSSDSNNDYDENVDDDVQELYDNDYDKSSKWREYRFLIICAILIAILVGASWWYVDYSGQKREKEADIAWAAYQDSLNLARQKEMARQDSINKVQQEEKQFLENFYKGFENNDDWDSHVCKHLTNKALQILREAFPYDCDYGDCLWTDLFFENFQGGTDSEDTIVVIKKVIEPVSPNTFLVTVYWGIKGTNTPSFNHKLKLGIVKEGDKYKIDNIVNVSEEEEREKTYRENSNQYSKYVGRWILRKTTDEGQKMLIEVILKENHNGEFAVFHDRGSVQDVIAYEVYTQCILSDGTIYMTKDGDINKDVPKLRVASDGLYSFDGGKYEKQNE